MWHCDAIFSIVETALCVIPTFVKDLKSSCCEENAIQPLEMICIFLLMLSAEESIGLLDDELPFQRKMYSALLKPT